MVNQSQGTRFCPRCKQQVDPRAPFCQHCGSRLPDPTGRGQQAQPGPKPRPAPPRRNQKLLIFLLLAISLTAVLVCGLGAMLLWPDQINGLFDRKDHGKFALEPRATDGSVSGSYRPPKNMGDTDVLFSVSPEGFATFRVEDAPESETLTVALGDERTASMTWAGVTLDGRGELTAQEREAMDALLTNRHNLLNSLEMIPLDIACLGEDTIDDKQVAALLFPVQMRLKYTNAYRQQAAKHDISLSTCDYASLEGNQAKLPSVIQYTPGMPVPVVHGYFPFDEVGAVEAPVSSAPGSDLACRDASPMMVADGRNASDAPYSSLAAPPADDLPVWGPCDAMCRGACGPDCTLNNCTLTKPFRCQKDEEGRNTEMGYTVFRYECGMHEGCIEHDACYDRCNATFGCGTWPAAYCRHGRVDALVYSTMGVPAYLADVALLGYEYCDEASWAKYGTLYTVGWVRGYGPKPLTGVFEYPDPTYSLDAINLIHDKEKCPKDAEVVEVEGEQVEGDPEGLIEGGEEQHAVAPIIATATTASQPPAAPTVAAPPTRAAAPTVAPTTPPAAPPTAAPTDTPGLLVWVRQEPAVVNANNDPLESHSTEARFAGTFTKMTPSENSFTTQDRYVEYEFEWYDLTITCNFDTPPIVLNPGLRYSVKVTCSNGGTFTQGGEGLGAQFWYSAQSGYQNIIDPQEVIKYYPWSPAYDGTTSKEWMITAPPVRTPGDTFQMYAGLWNRPPCNVTWTYRAEYH